MNRAIFLDRDGTINEDTHYLSHPSQLKILPNSIEGLRKLQEEFLLIIVSNQSGVGRGYFTEKDLKKINNKLIKDLKSEGVKITKIYYSPYYKDSKIPKYREGEFFRKPNPGMLLKAAEEFKIDLSASWIIGDKETDILTGINAGLKGFIYINNGPKEKLTVKPTKIVKNINEAAEWILKKESKVLKNYNRLKEIVEKLRKAGKKIVTTNGVFDILHIGHIRYLNEAKEFGDVLIVGINSDESVKKIKGSDRPINSEFSRAEVLSNLRAVDYCVIFNETDPRKLLSIIKPDIHIKGGDYKLEDIIERKIVEKNNGKVIIIPFIKGFSTTKIITRIKGE
jgi:glycerol-3-phosphate cytidylyltransferase